MLPLPRLTTVGSPESQTQPVGQGVPPTTHTVVQKPAFVVGSKSQLHAPDVKSDDVHAAPMGSERMRGCVVQRPTSVWQEAATPICGAQSASFWHAGLLEVRDGSHFVQAGRVGGIDAEAGKVLGAGDEGWRDRAVEKQRCVDRSGGLPSGRSVIVAAA